MSDLDVTSQENVLPTTEAPAAPPATPPSDSSLSSILDSALDRVQTPPPAGAAPPTPTSPGGAEASPAGEAGLARDAQGRFLPREATQAPPTPQTAPTAAPAQPAQQFLEAPASWRPELRPHWEKVPGEVRGYLHQREAELQNGFQAVAHRGQVAEAVLNEFVPYAEQLQREGATPVAAIRTLLQTAHQLRTGGPEYRKAILLSLAQQYGVNLEEPLNEQLARAEGQAANLLSEQMYDRSAGTQKTIAQTQQEFSSFANDPQNEFFPQVRGIMAHLIDNNVAPDLQTAYDMAVGMHAEVRKTLIDREYNRRITAERAKQAANVSVQGAPNGQAMRQAPPQGESLRATIERALGS